jgi:hypothetical protein
MKMTSMKSKVPGRLKNWRNQTWDASRNPLRAIRTYQNYVECGEDDREHAPIHRGHDEEIENLIGSVFDSIKISEWDGDSWHEAESPKKICISQSDSRLDSAPGFVQPPAETKCDQGIGGKCRTSLEISSHLRVELVQRRRQRWILDKYSLWWHLIWNILRVGCWRGRRSANVVWDADSYHWTTWPM